MNRLILAGEPQARRPKNLIVFILLGAMCCLVIGSWLKHQGDMAMLDTIHGQFNDQQLMISRGASREIIKELERLKFVLMVLAEGLGELRDGEGDPWRARLMADALRRLNPSGVRTIVLRGAQGGLECLPGRGCQALVDTGEAPETVEPPRPGEVAMDTPRQGPDGLLTHLRVELPDGEILEAELDLYRFLAPLLGGIRSGDTGYAWLIDQRGVFLYHYRPDFIGRDAFTARQERAPEMSFREINYIQKEMMLAGQEGVGVYRSGWHRDQTGEIAKLIAFAPVPVDAERGRFWSVAVSTPRNDLQKVVREFHHSQMFLELFELAVLAAAFGLIIFYEVRWSRHLAVTVNDQAQRLRHSEEKYRLLVESAEDFIFTLDRDLVVLSLNGCTARLLGVDPAQAAGGPLAALFPKGLPPRFTQAARLVHDTGRGFRGNFQWELKETSLWVDAHLMPIKEPAGGVSKVLCIARDQTQQHELERNLINTEKLASLGTLAAGLAHEINNPLGVMLGFCDLLLRKTPADSQEAEDLGIIQRQGLACKRIVENLLSFARQDRSGSASCDLGLCLSEIVQVVRHSFEMKQVRLSMELAPELPAVAAEKGPLQQVFLNLINNSLAACEPGGSLGIQARAQRDGLVTVTFADTGRGIGQEDLKHIYDPFFTTKPPGEGTGLGLFVTFGIVKKYGGEIACVSQGPDQPDKPSGTTFTVQLPTVGGAIAAVAPSPTDDLELGPRLVAGVRGG